MMTELPETVIAGPILRRATINRICVWLAATEKLNIKLEIFSDKNKVIGKSHTDRLYTECTQVGEKLFIYLLEARRTGSQTFPQDTFLTYQLSTKTEAAGSTFSNIDLSSLAYDGFTKPSFFIPHKLNNLLHGSCRKPHGGDGSQDGLYSAHQLLTENASNIEKRPPAIIMTGDQVYADDVSIILSSFLSSTAKKLIGEEFLPKGDHDNTEPYSLNEIKFGNRKDFLSDNKAKFTSTKQDNHLLSFGEYAAMYLYMFGYPSKEWSLEKEWNKNYKNNADEKLKKEFKALLTFEKTLPAIRKLLANIPSYMVFDDHDITDDWNITNMWHDGVRDSTLGRRIVANGLAAYWAFQACGNDPDQFSTDFKTVIGDFTQNPKQHERFEAFELLMWKHHNWGYSVPTSPPIIAIDSRTQRGFSRGNYLPILVDRYGLDWLRVEWVKLKSNPNITDIECPIFIAAAPVYGFTLVEFLQRLILFVINQADRYRPIGILYKIPGLKKWLIGKGIEAADIESWASNSKGQRRLLNCIAEKMHIRQCTFLSGDVHYGLTTIGSYQDGKTQLTCYQMISSSLRNEPSNTVGKGLEQLEKFAQEEVEYVHLGSFRTPSALTALLKKVGLLTLLKKIGWSTKTQLLTPNTGKNDVVVKECNIGLAEFENGFPVKHTLILTGAEKTKRIETVFDKKT